MRKENISFEQITNELTNVFAQPERLAQYQKNGLQYVGLCGWAGPMSPLTREAYIATFGEMVTTADEKPATATEKATEGENAGEDRPADGLELVEIADGVAVVGNPHTTYKNRREIKAHGARWNKEAQQWQATDADAVAMLRVWFGK